jgi:hypothetical protein
METKLDLWPLPRLWCDTGRGQPVTLDHRIAMPAGFPFAESRDVGQVPERREPLSDDLSPARTGTFHSARNLGFGEN